MSSQNTPLAIETCRLTHRFGQQVAVESLGLAVPQGAVYGFLGPNGSGKTTTIRLLLGLLRPQAGDIRILGRPMPAARRQIARHVGSMVETPAFYDHLSGLDNLEMTRRALGIDPSETRRVLDLVDLTANAHKRAGNYSLGMRQRLGIARALLGRPQLLILDEPTNGLDPAGVADIRHLIRSLPETEGVTVFVSSHLLSEIEQMASHVGLMSAGRLISQATLRDLLASAGGTIEVRSPSPDRALERLRTSGIEAEQAGDQIQVASSEAVTPEGISRLLINSGIDVSAIGLRAPSLEDVFLQHTRPTAD